jgi:NAD(P)-dependent dehydrogenase (short-subunit alcohol dehydrogenase family)
VAVIGGTMNFEDLNGEESYSASKAYFQSKLANVLFSKELARRLAGKMHA